MTPLNRAATALHESLTTADISMNGDLATFAVIAVLKAIREPSEEMVAAGNGVAEVEINWACAWGGEDSYCETSSEPFNDAGNVWQAMLDTILNEGAAK